MATGIERVYEERREKSRRELDAELVAAPPRPTPAPPMRWDSYAPSGWAADKARAEAESNQRWAEARSSSLFQDPYAPPGWDAYMARLQDRRWP